VIVGPGNEGAGAEGHRRMRASDADREQAIDVLKAAFAQGRLTRDELDVRVGQVLTSRTYADLDTLTSDIPGGIAAAPSAPRPAPAINEAPAGADVQPRERAIIATATLAGLALVAAVLLTGSPADGLGWLVALGSAFVSLFLLRTQMRGSRRDKRPGSQPPLTNPEAGSQTAPATQAEQLPWPRPRRGTNSDAGPEPSSKRTRGCCLLRLTPCWSANSRAPRPAGQLL
jgi:hypothetical protein